jgi:hypothetical protein
LSARRKIQGGLQHAEASSGREPAVRPVRHGGHAGLPGAGAILSRQAGHPDRHLRGWWRRRHHGAADRGVAQQYPRPARHHRQSRRRCDDDRHAGGDQGRSRRLHAAGSADDDGDQPGAAGEHAVRLAQRSRPGRADGEIALRGGDPAELACEHDEGSGGAGEEAARAGPVRLGRHWNRRPSRRRALRHAHRREDAACTLPRRRPLARRCRGWITRRHLRDAGCGRRAGRGRFAEGARRHHQRARRFAAEGSDCRRAGAMPISTSRPGSG